jgi:hypothetical protein
MRSAIDRIPRREAFIIIVVTAAVMGAVFALELLFGLFGFLLIL